MTKYFIQNNQDWNWDDLVSEEILLFSAPDDFEFTREICSKFLTEINVEHKLNDNGGFYLYKKGKYVINFFINSLLEKNFGWRDAFIFWLLQYDVKLLNWKYIE